MGKDSNKHLVGQPILQQILDLGPREFFDKLVLEHEADKYYKRFDGWTHFVTMQFAILSRCDSTAEIASGMQALHGKLNHPGLDSSPAKSTIGDGLRRRKEAFFKALYFALIDYYSTTLSVSHEEKVPFKHFYVFDSTTISLFSDVMKGVGRNPKGEGKKKGELKVHMMIDVDSDTAKFTRISDAGCTTRSSSST